MLLRHKRMFRGFVTLAGRIDHHVDLEVLARLALNNRPGRLSHVIDAVQVDALNALIILQMLLEFDELGVGQRVLAQVNVDDVWVAADILHEEVERLEAFFPQDKLLHDSLLSVEQFLGGRLLDAFEFVPLIT